MHHMAMFPSEEAIKFFWQHFWGSQLFIEVLLLSQKLGITERVVLVTLSPAWGVISASPEQRNRSRRVSAHLALLPKHCLSSSATGVCDW